MKTFNSLLDLTKHLNTDLKCRKYLEEVIWNGVPVCPHCGEEVYTTLKKKYLHFSVNHAEGEYVRGRVHTNTIEGAFGLYRRMIIGIYHGVSVKHTTKYLDEFAFRYNSRSNSDQARFNSMLTKSSGYLSYKDLIQKK